MNTLDAPQSSRSNNMQFCGPLDLVIVRKIECDSSIVARATTSTFHFTYNALQYSFILQSEASGGKSTCSQTTTRNNIRMHICKHPIKSHKRNRNLISGRCSAFRGSAYMPSNLGRNWRMELIPHYHTQAANRGIKCPE